MKRTFSLFGLIAFSLSFMTVFSAIDAHAVTAPVAGTFGYDLYDLAVNQILKGPIGFVAGVSAVIFGAFLAIQTKILPCLLCMLAGGMIIKADAITVTLGMVI